MPNPLNIVNVVDSRAHDSLESQSGAIIPVNIFTNVHSMIIIRTTDIFIAMFITIFLIGRKPY